MIYLDNSFSIETSNIEWLTTHEFAFRVSLENALLCEPLLRKALNLTSYTHIKINRIILKDISKMGKFGELPKLEVYTTTDTSKNGEKWYVKTVTYVSAKNKDYYVVQEFGFWISKPLCVHLEHNFEVYDENWNPLYKYTDVENEISKEEFIREEDKQC